MLMERKLKMKMCDFCEAVFDDTFYNILLDNPFVRLNGGVAFVKTIVKKYHIDKAK
jgi:hypothetical protein